MDWSFQEVSKIDVSIKPSRKLFNAENRIVGDDDIILFHFNIYIVCFMFYFCILSFVWFGLVWFYGISTIVGYLMPSPFYTDIYQIYDL